MITSVTVASRDWLVPFLLLLLRLETIRGRDLAEEIRGLGFEEALPAEVHRVLVEMEQEGVAVSLHEDGAVSTLTRRCEITPAGEAYLDFLAGLLERYREETDLFLETYASLSGVDREPVCGRTGEGRA